MTDCPNAEIRDQLPDLLHERLRASARAAVMAHVSSCAECQAELEVLRGVRDALAARTPRVDVARVVGALPKPVVRRRQVATARRVWTDWRVAAAVTLLVAGGTSAVVINRSAAPRAPAVTGSLDQDSALAKSVEKPRAGATQAPPVPTPRAAPSRQAAQVPETVAAVDDQSSPADIATDGRLGELNEQQLKALLGEIERMPAVPVTDPEPVAIRVNNRGSSASPEGQ